MSDETDPNASETKKTFIAGARDLLKRGKDRYVAYAKEHPYRTAIVTPLSLAAPFSPLAVSGLLVYAAIRSNDGLIFGGCLAGAIAIPTMIWSSNQDDAYKGAVKEVMHQINSCSMSGDYTGAYTHRSPYSWWNSKSVPFTLHGSVTKCLGDAPNDTLMTVKYDDGIKPWEETYFLTPRGGKSFSDIPHYTWDPKP